MFPIASRLRFGRSSAAFFFYSAASLMSFSICALVRLESVDRSMSHPPCDRVCWCDLAPGKKLFEYFSIT
jgi:hypothetical protein